MRGCGAVSLVVLLVSWLAFDDITTDSASRFPVEYSMLVLAGAWFAVLAGWLIAQRRVLAGACSLMAVAIGVAACWDLPHHYRPFSPLNCFVYVALAWFFGLSVRLVAQRVAAAAPGHGAR